MDKEWVVAEFIAHTGEPKDGCHTMSVGGFDAFAHAIAEAHEAEVGSLQARLAVMAEALRELSEHGLCGIDEIRWEAYAQADKALAAAPKVLFSGDMELFYSDTEPYMCFLPSPVAQLTLESQAKVIVLDPSEQGQDSEQSAILPCGHHADNAEWRAVCRECEKED